MQQLPALLIFLCKVRIRSLEELWNFIYVKTPRIKKILKTTTMRSVDALKEGLGKRVKV